MELPLGDDRRDDNKCQGCQEEPLPMPQEAEGYSDTQCRDEVDTDDTEPIDATWTQSASNHYDQVQYGSRRHRDRRCVD